MEAVRGQRAATQGIRTVDTLGSDLRRNTEQNARRAYLVVVLVLRLLALLHHLLAHPVVLGEGGEALRDWWDLGRHRRCAGAPDEEGDEENNYNPLGELAANW